MGAAIFLQLHATRGAGLRHKKSPARFNWSILQEMLIAFLNLALYFYILVYSINWIRLRSLLFQF